MDNHGGRSSVWRWVWSDRDEERADWNGYEECFDSVGDYEDWVRHIGSMIQRELSLTSLDTVADLGCGTGRYAAFVAPLVSHVFAFDYAEGLLKVATAKRQLPNISYQVADIATLAPETVSASKVYAVGSLFYLDSVGDVFDLIRRFVASGASFAAIDLPDRNVAHARGRSYDTSVYTHLDFDADELLAEFPGTRIVRDNLPAYANGEFRFNAFVPAR